MKISNIILLTLFILVFSTNVISKHKLDSNIHKQFLQTMIQESDLDKYQQSIYSQDLLNLKTQEQVHGPTGTATINGNIVNAGLTPIENHNVTLFRVEFGQRQYVATATTDNTGNYSFLNVAADTYIINSGNQYDDYLDYIWQEAVDGGPQLCSYCQIPLSSQFDLADGAVKDNVDFIIELGGSINGNLFDAMSLTSVTTFFVSTARTDGDNSYNLNSQVDLLTGDYTIKGIPDGDYRVYLQPSSYNSPNLHIPQVFGGFECNYCYRLINDGIGSILTITTANTLNNNDFALNTGASISGKIVDATSLNPLLEYNLVLVFDELNTQIGYIYFEGTNYDPLATGAYTIGGLLPGSYYVQGGDLGKESYQRELFANKPCYWSGCDRGVDGDAVVLSANENRIGVNFLLEVGGKISGTVTDDITGLPIELPAFERLSVSFYDATEAVIGGASVKADGSYTSARAMPAGNYAVRTGSMFHGNLSQPYVNEKYNDIPCAGLACDLTTADVAVVNGGITSNIDFALSQGFSFAGTITDTATGDPIPNVHVLVYKDMGIGQEPKFANWATTSDGTGATAVGTFEVSGLPAGTYYAVTNNGSRLPFIGLHPAVGAGWVDIIYNNMPCPAAGCDIASGTPIILPPVLRGGSQTSIDFNLAQGANISGKIFNYNDSAPIQQVYVNVFDDQGVSLGSFITGNNGEYRTAGFPAGTYYLTTSSFDVLVDVLYGNTSCAIDNCNPLNAVPIVLTEQQSLSNIDFVIKPDFVFGSSFD